MVRTQVLKIIISIFWFFPVAVVAQQKMPLPNAPMENFADRIEPCATDLLLQKMRESNAFKQREEKMNREVAAFRLMDDSSVYTLPVVFHVVSTNPSAIPDAVLLNALQELNDAFGKSGIYSGSSGADTRIRFCLAKTDSDGGITNGITRTTSFFSDHSNTIIEDGRLKNLVLWDPARYINIWYIASMHYEILPKFQCGNWVRMNAGGYATMPPGGGITDGIVVTAFGSMLAHEMGHYLGLYHTFEGLNCQNFDCTTDGDKVCDTPPDMSLSSSCTSPTNSCPTDTLSGFTTDQFDRMNNFMDYGNGSCANEFTEGQANRMRAMLNTQRPGLLVNKCDPPCAEAIQASFTRSNRYPLPGDLINFTNTTSGAATYEWLVDNVAVSNSTNFSRAFTAPGKYKVTLKAYNGSTCFGSFTDFVIVTCGVTSRFYTDKREIASKAGIQLDSIVFTNTSVNATSYRWLMSSNTGMAEQVITTAPNFTYVFQTPGLYSVKLIATNGACSDTTLTYTIPVNDPTADGALYMPTAECYQQTKVRLSFYVCNSGFNAIPKGTPISFYDNDPRTGNATKLGTTFYLPADIAGNCCGYLLSHIVDVGYKGLNTIYGVLNDSGNKKPLLLPGTPLVEKNYGNNISFLQNFAFKVSAAPASASMVYGDTLQLNAQARPGFVSSYVWSSPAHLSCTNCPSPLFIADSNIIKRVVATSNLGCTDTAYVTIKVPPYNDFALTINEVQCYQQDSLYVKFTIENKFKRGIIPKDLTVAFYDGDPKAASSSFLPLLYTVPDSVKAKTVSASLVIKGMKPGQLYGVVNASGQAAPVVLPNTTFLESDYNNNSGSITFNQFSVSVTPVTASLEWGDTLQLTATANVPASTVYVWSDPKDLSCTTCQAPLLIADKDIIKTVLATSQYGCTASASVAIKVPPYNDFSALINEVQCARNDSLYVNYSLTNSFKRGVLPKTLTVSFYNGNPITDTAHLLKPSFTLPDTVFAKTGSFSGFIKGMNAGNLYIVVNDSALSLPVQFPNTSLLEKSYANNITSFSYKPETVALTPSDTTVFRKEFVPIEINSTIYNPSSTLWSLGSSYSLSCTNCSNTTAQVFGYSPIHVQTENKYGCLIKGVSEIKIFPPDFEINVLDTKCFTNDIARVEFSICMNNAYDSVFAKIPISFYDGDPKLGRLLKPVFSTPRLQAGNCYTYTALVEAPLVSKQLMAVVNDKGTNRNVIPTIAYDETDLSNNMDTAKYTPFKAFVYPSDTAIQRQSSLVLQSSAAGGTISKYFWTPGQFLSCTTCATPTVTPDYNKEYSLILHNEYACVDTANVVIRTHTGSGVRVPNAFTPNNDGLNDVFYLFTGPDVRFMKTFGVYNRWGEKVFEIQGGLPNDPRFGWNGKVKGLDAPSGTYVYYALLSLANGKEHIVKGTVTLIR